MSFVKRIFGDPNEREVKKMRPIVDEINRLEPEIEELSDDDMRARTAEFREQLDQCEDQDEQDDVIEDILPEAFALVREAGRRTIGMRHYDVQLIGGMVLHQGKIAEMLTGEGKTLAATLPAYLNALSGRGVHIVTVNDYLAHRDSEWMGQIYRFLGLSVGCILSGPDNQDPNSKREHYAADITYGTNNEFGFDYLRDNMVPDVVYCVQRALNYGIVDEVDNILIDEARTPLIISAPSAESAETYQRFARAVATLKEGDDYEVDLKSRTVAVNDQGIDKVEALLGLDNIYGDMDMTRYLENALKAHAIFQRDVDYIVRDGEVIIVDEHTGRMMIGRRYSEGLHQAIEAKERVKVQFENRTVATITFQNYFRLYRKLAGMTGTAMTEAQEFDKIYHLDVVSIPTHKPMIRRDHTDFIFRGADAKYDAVVDEIRERHEQGQPLLVGTTSVENSERLSAKLDRIGIRYELLNAKNHTREAAIIAQAGRPGAVTISTNMAGRGTDILLGGNPDGMADDILREWDIDLEVATDADRAEALAEARRRCDADREKIIALGGLYVIGTERHDSRRIDNQLRGRAGRQGDPGETRFFISLQDDLMRRFGSDRMAGILKFLGMDENTPIEDKRVSGIIEQAQQKVETYYFDIRKNLVEYDDVISKHREIIYADRRSILEGQAIGERIMEFIREEVKTTIGRFVAAPTPENWDLDGVEDYFKHWDIELPEDFFPDNLNTVKRGPFIEQCVELAIAHYQDKRQSIIDQSDKLGQPTEAVEATLNSIERNILLRVVDSLWLEHIDSMDELRSGIHLRGVSQVDPLVEFKREGFKSFDHLKRNIEHFVAENIMAYRVSLQAPPPQPVLPARNLRTNTDEIAAAIGQAKTEAPSAPVGPPAGKKQVAAPKRPLTQTKAAAQAKKSGAPPAAATRANGNQSHNGEHANGATSQDAHTPAASKPVAHDQSPAKPVAAKPKGVNVATLPKVGPNDPCPCGSKVKYKFCHGAKH